MKLFKRCHAALCLSLLLAFCFSLTAFAAKSTTPAAVPSVTARTSSESAVSLTWKKASGATAYEVYMRTGTSGEFTRIATTKKTSYTKSKLRPGKTYYFYIRSVRSCRRHKILQPESLQNCQSTANDCGTRSSFELQNL